MELKTGTLLVWYIEYDPAHQTTRLHLLIYEEPIQLHSSAPKSSAAPPHHSARSLRSMGTLCWPKFLFGLIVLNKPGINS